MTKGHGPLTRGLGPACEQHDLSGMTGPGQNARTFPGLLERNTEWIVKNATCPRVLSLRVPIVPPLWAPSPPRTELYVRRLLSVCPHPALSPPRDPESALPSPRTDVPTPFSLCPFSLDGGSPFFQPRTEVQPLRTLGARLPRPTRAPILLFLSTRDSYKVLLMLSHKHDYQCCDAHGGRLHPSGVSLPKARTWSLSSYLNLEHSVRCPEWAGCVSRSARARAWMAALIGRRQLVGNLQTTCRLHRHEALLLPS